MKTNIVLVFAAVLIGMGPAVTVGTGTAHAARSCDFEFTRSVPTVLSPQITGDGIAACDVPPDERIVTLALEHEESGRWEVASTRTDLSIPPPYRAGGHSYTVSAACYAGKWRVSVGIRGKLPGSPVHLHQRIRHGGCTDLAVSPPILKEPRVSTPEPVEYPIDPENPPEFPGKLPREFSTPLREQLQQMAESVNPYLGPEHPVIRALINAANEITAVTFPKLNGYAEYTPDE